MKIIIPSNYQHRNLFYKLFTKNNILVLFDLKYVLKEDFYYYFKNIMFIYNSSIGSSLVHYNIVPEKPSSKFIQLNKQNGSYKYVEDIGNDSHSLYIPILELEDTTLEFSLK